MKSESTRKAMRKISRSLTEFDKNLVADGWRLSDRNGVLQLSFSLLYNSRSWKT